MPASAWIYQKSEQVESLGEDGASWYVGWYSPEGKRRRKSCGPGVKGKDKAEKLRRKVEADLDGGRYHEQLRKLWPDFRREFEEKVAEGMSPRTRQSTLEALKHFERLVKPARVFGITTMMIDEYVTKRRQERGHKRGTIISPATINKDLRHLRAVLRYAHDWSYLPNMPRFKMLREPGKLPTYVPPEHFAKLYEACAKARRPTGTSYPPADWWQALFTTAYLTGWRIEALLSLRWADIDLEAGTAISRWGDNKGKRDQKVALHPVVIEHLRRLVSFRDRVFWWPHGRRRLYEEFADIQAEAKVQPEDGKERYGFHDLRRAFATLNADRLTPDALQTLMQHKDYQTTQRYINMARQLNAAVANLYVPAVSKGKAGGA
jgi:integrase